MENAATLVCESVRITTWSQHKPAIRCAVLRSVIAAWMLHPVTIAARSCTKAGFSFADVKEITFARRVRS